MATAQQAARSAETAREKMQARREALEGAAGWVAEDRKYEEVRESIQGDMDALARRRRFPVFG